MDQGFSRHVLLLILGVTAVIFPQQIYSEEPKEESERFTQGENKCPNNWICPSNVPCEKKTACRCEKDYYQCQKKGVRVCRDIRKKPNVILICTNGTMPPNTTNCNNRICPECKLCNKSFPCIPGYSEASDGDCVEINECREGLHLCDVYTECRNSQGSYSCVCIKGFQKENVTEFCPSDVKKNNSCTDIDECRNSPGICGSNFICNNTKGSYNCVCEKGFTNVSNSCVAMKVEIKCEFSSSEMQKKEECDKMTTPDAACSILQKTFQLFISSCHSKVNITIEKAKNQLENDTKELNNILNKHKNSNDDSTNDGELTTEILRNVEKTVLKSFLDTPRTQQIKTAQLDVSIQVSQNICSPGVKFFTMISGDNLMQVPCDQLNKDAGDGGIFIVYKDSSLKRNLFSKQDTEDNGHKTVINSRVVTGAITRKLTSDVIFTLAHIEALKPSHNLTCVFWDPEDNGWSEDGCTTKFSNCNGTHTTCTCNHLSSFALLMAPYGLEHNHGLSIVSYIGLSLSVLCLVLSLLTFILCRTLRSSHTSVLTAMCSCLFLGQLLFLVGIQQTCNKVLCAIIAGALHFLFLCAFCWMFIESVLLFMTVRNLRAVNYMTSRRSNFPMMCLLGFGVPTIIVGISAAVQPNAYGTKTYCWLKSTSAVWSFLGPVAVFIITNTILLVFTVVLLKNRLASLNTNVSTLKNSRLLTFKALAQLFILGCTWGIGYFQFVRFENNSPVISYIFTICNSLQGVYIFLVHCVLNHQVRQEYRKLICRAGKHRKQSSEDTSHHVTTKSMTLTEISKPAIKEQSSVSESKVNWK